MGWLKIGGPYAVTALMTYLYFGRVSEHRSDLLKKDKIISDKDQEIKDLNGAITERWAKLIDEQQRIIREVN